MGHCSELGYALWPQATAANLIMCYGPLYAMKTYSNNRGPYCRIWLCTLGGDGSILLRSKYLQRYTSIKIKFSGGFSEFLCLRQQNFHDYICNISLKISVKCCTIKELWHKNKLFCRSIALQVFRPQKYQADPLWAMCSISLCAMSHRTEFIMHYALCRIWLWAMRHSANKLPQCRTT